MFNKLAFLQWQYNVCVLRDKIIQNWIVRETIYIFSLYKKLLFSSNGIEKSRLYIAINHRDMTKHIFFVFCSNLFFWANSRTIWYKISFHNKQFYLEQCRNQMMYFFIDLSPPLALLQRKYDFGDKYRTKEKKNKIKSLLLLNTL